MGAACGGEVVAAFVHVPTELIKQNAQVVLFKRETLTFQARSSEQNIPLIVKTIINRNGFLGLYQGTFFLIIVVSYFNFFFFGRLLRDSSPRSAFCHHTISAVRVF
jgi:hypothetical protein